jgi:hypothetical protein
VTQPVPGAAVAALSGRRIIGTKERVHLILFYFYVYRYAAG